MNVSSILHRTPTRVLGDVAALRYRSPALYGKSREYQRFIILGHARTGSTLVSSLLREHENVWCFSEVFNARAIQFFTPGLSNDSRLLKVLRDRDPFEFLNRFVFRGYREEIRAVGFKLFPEQIRLPHMPSLIEAFAADADIRFIHIRRANHLRVIVSLKLARSTAQWSSRGDGHPPDARVTVEREELEAFSRQRRADEAMLRERFQASSLYEIEYTELVHDLPRVLNEIQDHLGIPRASIEPVLRKQTTGPLKDRIVNYERLRADMTGTECSVFFEE